MKKKMILGMKVKDRVTGYTGVLVSKSEWLNGCVRVGIQAKVGKDGKVPDTHHCDIEDVVMVGTGVSETYKPTGGPRNEAIRGQVTRR